MKTDYVSKIELAIDNNDTKSVKKNFKKSKKIYVLSKGNSLLTRALEQGNYEIVKYLLKHIRQKEIRIDETTILKNFIHAINKNRIDFIRLLFKYEFKNKYYYGIIHAGMMKAIELNFLGIVKYLWNFDKFCPRVHSDIKCIEQAAFYGNAEIFYFFLNAGIDISDSLYYCAAGGKNDNLLRFILEITPNKSMIMQGLRGAVRNGNIDLVKFFILKYDLIINDEIIIEAIKYSQIKLLEYLFSKNPDIEDIDSVLSTIIIYSNTTILKFVIIDKNFSTVLLDNISDKINIAIMHRKYDFLMFFQKITPKNIFKKYIGEEFVKLIRLIYDHDICGTIETKDKKEVYASYFYSMVKLILDLGFNFDAHENVLREYLTFSPDISQLLVHHFKYIPSTATKFLINHGIILKKSSCPLMSKISKKIDLKRAKICKEAIEKYGELFLHPNSWRVLEFQKSFESGLNIQNSWL